MTDPSTHTNLLISVLTLFLLPIVVKWLDHRHEERMKAMKAQIDTNTVITQKAAAQSIAVGEIIATESRTSTPASLRARASEIARDMARESNNGGASVHHPH